jgi:hypothetical protein
LQYLHAEYAGSLVPKLGEGTLGPSGSGGGTPPPPI